MSDDSRCSYRIGHAGYWNQSPWDAEGRCVRCGTWRILTDGGLKRACSGHLAQVLPRRSVSQVTHDRFDWEVKMDGELPRIPEMSDRQKDVLALRYHPDGSRRTTYAEMARLLGITTERVRQLVSKAERVQRGRERVLSRLRGDEEVG